ncbi:hypothetical protein [Nonomuraea jabiensis]
MTALRLGLSDLRLAVRRRCQRGHQRVCRRYRL